MIRSIKISHFRGIEGGSLDKLTLLTILVGPNGCGKSTVLDGLWLGAHPAPAAAMQELQERRFPELGTRWFYYRGDGERLAAVAATNSAGVTRHILLRPQGAGKNLQISLGVQVEDPSVSSEGKAAATDGIRNAHMVKGFSDVPEVVLVLPPAIGKKRPLYELYTALAERGGLGKAKAIVTELVPGLHNVEILTHGSTPVVNLVFDGYSHPLEHAGDGIQTLVRLSFELGLPAGGLVLLEEPEVHMHPAAMRQLARAIMAAVRRDVQVVLTTHSLDLIDAILAACTDEDLNQRVSINRLSLNSDGQLGSIIRAGAAAATARSEIEEDLR